MKTIRPNVNDGDLHPNAWGALREEVARYADGAVLEITVKKAKKKRSLSQNSFMHGPFLESMHAMYVEFGNDYSMEMVKAILKAQFGPKDYVYDGVREGAMEIDKPSSEWDTLECEAAMEDARRYYAEFWQLPYPNEVIDDPKQ